MKIALTAAVTALVCFAVASATGLGAASPTVLKVKPHEIVELLSDNFHCEVLTTTEVACGANSLPNSVQVYFTPHAVALLKLNKTGTKGGVIANIKR